METLLTILMGICRLVHLVLITPLNLIREIVMVSTTAKMANLTIPALPRGQVGSQQEVVQEVVVAAQAVAVTRHHQHLEEIGHREALAGMITSILIVKVLRKQDAQEEIEVDPMIILVLKAAAVVP